EARDRPPPVDLAQRPRPRARGTEVGVGRDAVGGRVAQEEAQGARVAAGGCVLARGVERALQLEGQVGGLLRADLVEAVLAPLPARLALADPDVPVGRADVARRPPGE